jgi:primosomal protein N' (replication factor Y)
MNKEKEVYADVILPLAVGDAFTYKIPQNLQSNVERGKRAIVQFGKRRVYSAIIYRIHQNPPKEYKTKPILDVLDDSPIVNSEQFELWEWMADYYMCHLGDVYKAAIPSGLKLESQTKVVYNHSFNNNEILSEKENSLLDIIKIDNIIGLEELSKKTGHKNILPFMNSLMEKGAIQIEEKLIDSYKPKKEKYLRLNFSPGNEEMISEAFKKLERAPKQMNAFMHFIKLVRENNNSEEFTMEKRRFKEIAGVNSNILRSLTENEILFEETRDISRIDNEGGETTDRKELTEAQKEAYLEIKEQWNEKDVVLLHGVTSSGKTEIYIDLIKEQLEAGKQVLYLLPEIALTSQIIKRLKMIFGDKVGVYHSKFPDNQRVEIYQDLLKGTSSEDSIKIILGVRSSVFLPFKNLGLIIVDEEHENTYKQFDPAPRYNARDVAVILATIHQAKALLGTATPSVESYFNSKREKYGFVELNQRYLDIQLPEIEVVDIFKARREKRLQGHFTETLINRISEALNQNEQVILFQNRRGFSPYIECETCGWIPECKFCDVSLTYHRKNNRLVCHYCGYNIKLPDKCPSCNSNSLVTRGFGTEKIEEEIALFLPDAKIKRMDLDTTRKRNAYEKIIDSFEKHEIDILIGTQMVSKGLDFDNVSVVGILNADNLINFPDFRAHERSFQLMAQVSGRSGRKKKRGTVIIQTSQPNHQILKNVLNNDYVEMFKNQINERKQFMYPPFYRIIKILLKHKDWNKLDHASNLLSKELKRIFSYRLLGPQSPLVGRVQSYHIKHILVKIEKEKSLKKTKELIIRETNKIKMHADLRSLQVNFDVDPM